MLQQNLRIALFMQSKLKHKISSYGEVETKVRFWFYNDFVVSAEHF